jgi:Amt family ammonium transporter
VGIHGIGGMIGTLCLGIFASRIVNPGGADGLLAGNLRFLGIQALGVVAVAAYAFAASWILLKVMDVSIGLRLSEEQEIGGLDLNEHSEKAYNT